MFPRIVWPPKKKKTRRHKYCYRRVSSTRSWLVHLGRRNLKRMGGTTGQKGGPGGPKKLECHEMLHRCCDRVCHLKKGFQQA